MDCYVADGYWETGYTESDVCGIVPARPRAVAGDFLADEFGGLRLYHGSPHDFDKFSMDKIGTGEGAQAYGHGLYFADNETVARTYRDKVSAMLGMSQADVAQATGIKDEKQAKTNAAIAGMMRPQ